MRSASAPASALEFGIDAIGVRRMFPGTGGLPLVANVEAAEEFFGYTDRLSGLVARSASRTPELLTALLRRFWTLAA